MKEKNNINILEELKNIIRIESNGLETLIEMINEKYEKPATYTQNGRQFRFGFKKLY